MPRLNSANFAVTTLVSGISAAATSFQVADASSFPDTGPFMILVHDATLGFEGVREIMEVGTINKGTNTFSDVLRGREGMAAVAHTAGVRVECVWTAGMHAELEDVSNKGQPDGYASLDEEGSVPLDQLGNVASKRVVRLVVGTSTSGWAEKDCDYLCDGTADDVEINNAITALPATGGEVVILDGTYNITASINIPKDNVSIRGSGNATTLKRRYNSTNTDSGPTAMGLITLNEKSGCKIQGLQIDGNKATYTVIYNYGIYLSSSSNNTVTGNTCNNNYYGIYLSSSSDNTVTGNTCNNNNFGIRISSSSDNTVTGNTCNNNSNYGICLAYSSNNNTVTGNTCNNNNSYGIYLNSSNNNNTVTGNTCNNNNYGIYLISSSNNTVTGNTCNNNNSYGIILDLSSNNNTITGNICIRGTGQTSEYTSDQYTIRLYGTDNNYNLISSNNCMGKAPKIDGGIGNTVFNNKWDESSDFEKHLADTMPHRFTDGTKTYRWGLAVISGVVNMVYEEVV